MNNDSINTEGAAKTGDQPTLTVAIEQNFPEECRIIEDSIAPELYSGFSRFWIIITKVDFIRNLIVSLNEKFAPGAYSLFLVRKRYIDERLIQVIREEKIEVAVNLGAGFDTRFFRLNEAQNIIAWEIDQAVNIEAKRKSIEKALGTFPKHVKQISMNFIDQPIETTLKQEGYTGTDRTFFIWEAVSQYLDETSIQKMFEFFSKAPKGSLLVFTYILKNFVEGRKLYGQELMYKKAVKGNLWHSGFHPIGIGTELKKHGWQLIEDLDQAELNDRYVKPTGRTLEAMEIERFVFARKL